MCIAQSRLKLIMRIHILDMQHHSTAGKSECVCVGVFMGVCGHYFII